MKLSSSSDYFLIIGGSDGSDDYIHEYMFITTERQKNKTTSTRMRDAKAVIILLVYHAPSGVELVYGNTCLLTNYCIFYFFLPNSTKPSDICFTQIPKRPDLIVCFALSFLTEAYLCLEFKIMCQNLIHKSGIETEGPNQELSGI